MSIVRYKKANAPGRIPGRFCSCGLEMQEHVTRLGVDAHVDAGVESCSEIIADPLDVVLVGLLRPDVAVSADTGGDDSPHFIIWCPKDLDGGDLPSVEEELDVPHLFTFVTLLHRVRIAGFDALEPRSEVHETLPTALDQSLFRVEDTSDHVRDCDRDAVGEFDGGSHLITHFPTSTGQEAY